MIAQYNREAWGPPTPLSSPVVTGYSHGEVQRLESRIRSELQLSGLIDSGEAALLSSGVALPAKSGDETEVFAELRMLHHKIHETVMVNNKRRAFIHERAKVAKERHAMVVEGKVHMNAIDKMFQRRLKKMKKKKNKNPNAFVQVVFNDDFPPLPRLTTAPQPPVLTRVLKRANVVYGMSHRFQLWLNEMISFLSTAPTAPEGIITPAPFLKK